jgi:DNA-binding transcriptional regulator YiaG
MKKKKIQKSYIDNGFGFPVQIVNAPLLQVRGSWSLDLNFEKYERAVLMALAHKPSRLTGSEIKFIRNYYEMNLKNFGERFGNVAHSAVIKWEKFTDSPTNMNWACEKDIRLFIISEIKPQYLTRLYSELETIASGRNSKIKLEVDEIKAA